MWVWLRVCVTGRNGVCVFVCVCEEESVCERQCVCVCVYEIRNKRGSVCM